MVGRAGCGGPAAQMTYPTVTRSTFGKAACTVRLQPAGVSHHYFTLRSYLGIFDAFVFEHRQRMPMVSASCGLLPLLSGLLKAEHPRTPCLRVSIRVRFCSDQSGLIRALSGNCIHYVDVRLQTAWKRFNSQKMAAGRRQRHFSAA